MTVFLVMMGQTMVTSNCMGKICLFHLFTYSTSSTTGQLSLKVNLVLTYKMLFLQALFCIKFPKFNFKEQLLLTIVAANKVQ